MSYKIHPSAWGAVFPVPSQIVDKHIRLAGATQLKALLWLLRHASDTVTIEELSAAIGQKPADTVDALQYWLENGIIAADDTPTEVDVKDNTKSTKSDAKQASEGKDAVAQTTPAKEQKKKDKDKDKPKAKSLPALPVTKPNYEQILARAKESPEIKFLFSEAQVKLGRTIGYEAQCALLMMHDQYGLPVEVILMILEYAVSVNKIAYSYIASIGRDWGEKEIDTIDKADEQITALRTVNTLWKKFSAMAGLTNPRPTAAQVPYIRSWGKDMGYDAEMIFLAYEQMANHCQRLSLPYMDKVLKTWHNAGIKTPEDVEKANQARSAKKVKQTNKAGADASYGLDDFKHSSLHDPIVYEKRKK
ncbi:MAG TPA: DnaD domain protein [Clostridia bacterium]|nr:DnaD domain protein [Clostridia bacterium]